MEVADEKDDRVAVRDGGISAVGSVEQAQMQGGDVDEV